MSESQKEFRKAIREMRKLLRLPQSWVAAKSGVDRSMLSQWENGKIELTDAQTLSIGRVIGAVVKERAEANILPAPQVQNGSPGRYVAQERKEWGITQLELADKADMAEDSISLFENGYVELESEELRSLYSALNSLVDKKRSKLGIPKPEGVPLSSLASLAIASPVQRQVSTEERLRKQVELLEEALSSRKEAGAALEKVRAIQDEIIEELKTEIARLELLNKELGESKDRELQSLREQLEAKKRVTIPSDEYDGLE